MVRFYLDIWPLWCFDGSSVKLSQGFLGSQGSSKHEQPNQIFFFCELNDQCGEGSWCMVWLWLTIVLLFWTFLSYCGSRHISDSCQALVIYVIWFSCQWWVLGLLCEYVWFVLGYFNPVSFDLCGLSFQLFSSFFAL